MSDDILDVAQKTVNDAAQQAGSALDTSPVTKDNPSPPLTNPSPSPELPVEPDPTPMDASQQSTTPSNAAEILLETNSPERIVVPSADPPSHHDKTLPKKSGKGPLIALVALLLLVLPVSVFFISKQNQQLTDTRSRASGVIPYGGLNFPCFNSYQCANGYHCQDGTCQGNPITDTCGRNTDPGAPVCCTGTCPAANRVCEGSNRLECNTGGVHCTIDADGCVPSDDTGDDTGDDTVVNTPTPTTGPTPVCQNIKLYKDGVQVTDLTTLRAGNAVVLAVKGNLSPTKAHFRVNGGAWTETTTTNSSGEFTLAYTIPDGVMDFVIEGEVYTNGAWR